MLQRGFMGMHCNHLCWADELDKDIDEAVAKAIEEQRKRILRLKKMLIGKGKRVGSWLLLPFCLCCSTYL